MGLFSRSKQEAPPAPAAPAPAPTLEQQLTPELLERLRQALADLPVAVGRPHPYHDVNQNIGVITLTLLSDYLQRHLYSNEKYAKSKRVTHFSAKFYSMAGEDGIIREILRRIGIAKGYFVEFGVDIHGLENNTLYLLLKGWKGLWIEVAPPIVTAAKTSFAHSIEDGSLTLINERVNAENIEAFLDRAGAPADFDLLSVDIDGNDYWVWKAISRYRPKVVIIEYNAILGDEVSCVMPYDPGHAWTGSYYMGASLKALEKLGRDKGYHLVGCDYQGVNAYFVRKDLTGTLFEEPFTTEHHYEPLRVFLTRGGGSLLGFGRFEHV